MSCILFSICYLFILFGSNLSYLVGACYLVPVAMFNIVLTLGFYKKHSRVYKRIHDSYILEYIWIDGPGGNLRSKYRTAYPNFDSMDDSTGNSVTVEDWSCDGEIALVPVAHFSNPFFEPGRAFLVLCETRRDNGTLTDTNFRCDAVKVFDRHRNLDAWFGLEQEYAVFIQHGAPTAAVTSLAEKHYEYCFQAGLKISGIGAADAESRWEFKIGPCSAIGAADELWVARYILHKLSEEFGVCISFNGGGLCTNFSTTETRESRNRKQDGLKCIYKYIDRLSKNHGEHIRVYGDNSQRLTGACDYHTLRIAAGGGAATIRIPKSVLKAGCGYLEDRRPASDADPYQVTAAIFKTACLDYI